jgi:glycosyl-4,4'-diaponeurosporenoate acyltransferase
VKSVLIDLPILWILVLNIGGCLAIQMGFAWAFTRMPAAWFHPSRAFAWERDGHFYEAAFRIKKWKHHLPDAARWFAGGFAKGTLAGKQRDYLERFIRETWRGELCHWAAIVCEPVLFLWNPWWGDGVILVYALAANLPCVLVQRHNRARFQRLLLRSARRPAL